jgi:hypothetical protein
MHKTKLLLIHATAAFGLLFVSEAQATEFARPEDDKGIFSLVYENDIFAHTDRGYTNGVRAGWLSSEANAPDWIKWSADHFLPLASDGDKRLSVALGQSMFTPADLSQRTPILTDRPYAGWLYGSIGVVSDTGKTLDNVMLTVGVVGPYSFAEQTQKFVHKRITDSPDPKGWNNQLKTEPGVILTYERKWRSLYQISPMGIGVDFTPAVGVNLGNIETDAIVSTMFRIGYDLPADYGPPRVRPSLPGSDFFIPTRELGGYIFAGFEGRGVARNIFLDGNTFASSQHISKKPFVGSTQAGVAVTYGEARLSYTQVFMTREFNRQLAPEQFGVLTLSYRF